MKHHQVWLLLLLISACREAPPEPKPAGSTAPAVTTAATATATSTSTAGPAPSATADVGDRAALVKKLIGRWKGPFEAEYQSGGRYIIHGGAKQIPGQWEVLEVPAADTLKIKIMLPGLNSNNFVTLRFVNDDELAWDHRRKRKGAPIMKFTRVTP